MNYEQILLWQRGSKAEQVAAELASLIQKGSLSKWDSLPLNSTLAGKFDVSTRTISEAKRLLKSHGLLTLLERRYYVA